MRNILIKLPSFHDLGIGDASVGHVGVYAAASIPIWPGASSARHRLVVPHAFIAKCDVVHATLQTTIFALLSITT